MVWQEFFNLPEAERTHNKVEVQGITCASHQLEHNEACIEVLMEAVPPLALVQKHHRRHNESSHFLRYSALLLKIGV